MFMHIEFADHSNPVYRPNMDKAEFSNMKRRWSQNYKLTLVKEFPEGKCYYAEEKERRTK